MNAAILECPWCDYRIVINPRGGHGRSQGNGYDAALMMAAHVESVHERTWREFLSGVPEDQEVV